jgi:hypothetical protein
MSNLSTPALAPKGEVRPRYERVAYFIVKSENGREYVVKVEDGKQTHLLRAAPAADHSQTARQRSFDAILEDLHAAVYEATPEQFIEATLGEPVWKYDEDTEEGDGFRFVEKAERLFKEPPERESEPGKTKKEKPLRAVKEPARDEPPVCAKHNRPMHKNGVSKRTGQQQWRCSKCVVENKGKPRGGARRPAPESDSGDSWAQARAAHVSKVVKKNPKCATCNERLRIKGRHRNKDGTESVYYFCSVNGCVATGHEAPNARRNRLPDTFEEVLDLVRKRVTRMRGYHPQDFDDIVQEVATDLWQKKLKPKDLNDRERMRNYIHSQTQLSQDKFDRTSLDAPAPGKNGEDSKETYADRLKSSVPNPEEELLAREAGSDGQEG